MIAARSSLCASHCGAQVLEVDRAVVGGLDHDDLHPGHHRGRGVGAVRRGRDQADVAGALAAGPVVAADRQQAGQLALGAGVRLDGDLVVAGDLGQPLLELLDEVPVADRVLGRRERVQVGEARQRHRLHLGGRVELHGARAERDHAAVQRVVARRQPAQVAQHRGLAVVGREHLVREVRRGAAQRLGQRVAGGLVDAGQVEGGRAARDAERREARRSAWTAWSPRTSRCPTRSASTSRRCRPSWRADATTSAARPGTTAVMVSKNSSDSTCTPPSASARARTAAYRCTRVAIDLAAPRGRGRRRTSRRRRPAAPGRCRCWRSPCRGGCAARGSAAPAGRPDGPRRRRTPRPGGRAGAARAPRPRP